MTNEITTRESLILSFLTHSDRTRSLNLPNPMPNLSAPAVRQAAEQIIAADVFDPEHGTGRPVAVSGAVREIVTTNKLF